MERLLRSRIASNLLLIAASAVLPAAILHSIVGEDRAPISATQHLVVMVPITAIAAAASAALMIGGLRRADTRAVVAGGAFAAMTLLLTIHAVTTPGVIFGDNGVVAITGGLALPTGGTIMAVAALPAMRDPRHVRTVAYALGAFLDVVLALAVLALVFPDRVPAVPGYDSPEAIATLVVGIGLYGVVAERAVRTFTLTRRRADLLVVVGTVWLGFALIPSLMCDPWTWGWWLSHALEVAGAALVGIPVALDVHRGRPSSPLAGDLPAAALVAEEEAFLGARVRVLLARLAEKDPSTEQHTRRVAEWAVRIGEALGLSPGRLRELAIAGLLHDIGKLSTPDAILGKPGALSDEEFAVVRRHPVAGDALLAELGYPARIRRGVRGHHERLDGSGYPDGLAGDALDLETRILAVADVWDALVSPRVYRSAWPPERAMTVLVQGIGTEFDPRCVRALQALAGAALPAGDAGTLARLPRAA
jgi:putative nucleotidyltransferase with HDIG domain